MSSKNKIDITESEWIVMQALWEKSPQTLGEIAKTINNKADWNKTTINTLLRRLMKKEAVSYKEARFYKYYPLVTEKECLKAEMKDILNKFFYSSPQKLMATLVESEDFSKDDISELEKLLKQIKEKGE